MFSSPHSRTFACAVITLLVTALLIVTPADAAEPVTELGNNVAVPVIFAEGYNIVGGDVSAVGSGFRSSELDDNFAEYAAANELYFMPGLVDAAGAPLWSNWFYPQKTTATWQAEWVDATDTSTLMTLVAVTRLDWGDSLLSKAWTVRSKIRLEVRLYRTNDLSLQGYGMNHLEGEGITEVWGAADATDATEVTDPASATPPAGAPCLIVPSETTVYSNCARLTLYRIDALGGSVVGDPVFSMPVADKYGTDGPTGFGAEVNVGGYVLYGYTLDAKALKLTKDCYRVVFSLDDSATWDGGSVTRNTVITGLDPLDSIRDASSESEWPFKSEMNAEGTASWVDFQLLLTTGGGKKPR